MAITEVVKRLAMAHPTVGFTLTTGERAGLRLPAQPLGADGHLARLGRIMGREFLDDALADRHRARGRARRPALPACRPCTGPTPASSTCSSTAGRCRTGC